MSYHDIVCVMMSCILPRKKEKTNLDGDDWEISKVGFGFILNLFLIFILISITHYLTIDDLMLHWLM